MESSEKSVLISTEQLILTGRFMTEVDRGAFFNLFFPNILTNPGHNFTNLNFCDVTLLFSWFFFIIEAVPLKKCVRADVTFESIEGHSFVTLSLCLKI